MNTTCFERICSDNLDTHKTLFALHQLTATDGYNTQGWDVCTLGIHRLPFLQGGHRLQSFALLLLLKNKYLQTASSLHTTARCCIWLPCLLPTVSSRGVMSRSNPNRLMKSCTPENSRNKKATEKPITTVSQNHNQQTIPSAGQFPAATLNSNHASSKSCMFGSR
jgi:hypothetical protein